MSDYGHDLRFGIFPSPDAASAPSLLELVALAEVSGLDLVSIQDHPYQRNHLDAWTLLSFLGARTSTITLAPNVVSLPLRPPAVLAKSAASLDVLTDGRVELGLGAGAFWDAIVAAGGPRRTPGEAVEALTEAIEVIRAFWSGSSVFVDGEHYRVHGLRPGPVPAHAIPIWVGAYKPRMLRLTGRLADAWIPSMGYAEPGDLGPLNARIDEAAVAAGRAPEAIRRMYNISGAFGRGSGVLQGSPADWSEQLAQLTLEQGMSTFILGTGDPDDVRRFALEVAPLTRELVEAARATGPGHTPVTSAQVSRPLLASPVASPVAPTPDDGSRLTGELAWDEASRPTRPTSLGRGERAEDGEVAYPRADAAQHLVDVHDGLRAELERVRDIVAQVRAGHLQVGQARSVINTMTMRQNNWTLGAYCASYCRFVGTHHTLEDRSIFPHLRRSEAVLADVLDRLEQEHLVIHDVLEQLDEALVHLVGTDGTGSVGAGALDALQHQVDLLTDTLLSHLAYEERELLEPIARHGLQ